MPLRNGSAGRTTSGEGRPFKARSPLPDEGGGNPGRGPSYAIPSSWTPSKDMKCVCLEFEEEQLEQGSKVRFPRLRFLPPLAHSGSSRPSVRPGPADADPLCTEEETDRLFVCLHKHPRARSSFGQLGSSWLNSCVKITAVKMMLLVHDVSGCPTRSAVERRRRGLTEEGQRKWGSAELMSSPLPHCRTPHPSTRPRADPCLRPLQVRRWERFTLRCPPPTNHHHHRTPSFPQNIRLSLRHVLRSRPAQGLRHRRRL